MTKQTYRWLPTAAAMVVWLGVAGCWGEARPGAETSGEAAEGRESREHTEDGEHGEGGEHAAGAEGEGEEAGVYVTPSEPWDAVRRGARLVLSFDPEAGAFMGSVENTAGQALCDVRVEVHLSDGTELGPTEPTDLAPGQTVPVNLPTGGAAFASWTAHPEVSACGGTVASHVPFPRGG